MDREKKKLDGKSFDIIEDNIKKLQELFPEIVTEGKVDIDKLALLFDKARNEDTEGKLDGEERYEFTWKGKKEAIRLAQKQSTGTLRPCREDSVNFDETQNLYIEGDNLEVLRALQSSYRGKVKMIYIDPPYNTGNDFVYKDDFKDNIGNYKEKMNEAYKTNTRKDGRYNTNWLNMIYPRLKLARNLLKDSGVIFISIDDNEQSNLKLLCDDIFGEDNFQGMFVINSSPSAIDYGNMAKMHEYALMYSKNSLKVSTNQIPEKDKKFKYTDDKGGFNIYPLYNGNVAFNPKTRPNLYYPFYLNTNKNLDNGFFEIGLEPKKGWVEVWPVISKKDGISRVWRWGKEQKSRANLNKEIVGYLNEDGEYRIVQKSRLDKKTIRSILLDKSMSSRRGTSEIQELFGRKVFTFPKPVELIKQFLTVGADDDSYILDFFSGSCTTAQAVMQLNSEDNGKRKFIMVQIPEETDEKSEAFKAGYKNICEIGKERIRRAGNKILEENKGKEGIEDLDIGFKVFKLDSTNLKAWDENLQSDKDMVEQLEDLQNPIKEGRTTEDLVYEIMLKYGVDLTMPIEELEILGSKVYLVGCGYLMICLEDNISLDLIEAIGNEKPNRVVLADKGLTTSDLINGEKILTELGVQDIRTI